MNRYAPTGVESWTRLLDCQAIIQQELLEKRQGRSRGNRSVTILDCQATPGQLIKAHIHAARPHSLVGRQEASA